MVAADRGNVDLALLLLEAGANVHLKSKDQFNNSILHLVISDMNDSNIEQRMQLLEIFLEYGADLTAINNKGEAPLHCLITVDKAENMIKPLAMLIAYGVSCNARDGRGATFMHNLVELRNCEMLSVVRRHYVFLFNDTLKNKENLTPLEYAQAIRCDECIIRFKDPLSSYQKVSVVNNFDINGLTYLMVAAMTNNFTQAEKYLADKGDISGVSNDYFRYTALHYALVFKNIKMVQWLLDHQASTDVQNARGYTPAQLFIAMGACEAKQPAANIDIFLKIISKDPKVLNMQDSRGDTIIHILARRNNSALLKTLTNLYLNQIDITIRNKSYQNPLEIAERFGYTAVIDILKTVQRTQGKVN